MLNNYIFDNIIKYSILFNYVKKRDVMGDWNEKNIIFSLDIGTRSIKGAVIEITNGKLKVLDEEYVEHEERAMHDGQIHNISLVAKAVSMVKKNLENRLNYKLETVAIAAAGRFLKTINVYTEVDISEDIEIDKDFIKTLELYAIKDAEKKIIEENPHTLYCVGYTVRNYTLNGYNISNLLCHKGTLAGVDIIATFLPSSVVDSLYAVMKLVNLNVIALTLEPIAAIEAIIPQSLRLLNLALVDVGAGTSDIAISSNDSLVGYGMVPLAGDEVTEVISKRFLLDFNSGEELKKKYSSNEELNYRDVLGFDYITTPLELEKVINPVVENIASEIAKEILRLNGDKSPSAVFLIGGGAHTPMLQVKLCEKLNIPPQRIAIKGRDSVSQCISSDLSLGSIGVTVLGIAQVAMNNKEENYIQVFLNGTSITLFNFKEHKIAEVLVQASVNPRLLLGKKGKDICFSVNDVEYTIIGDAPSPATIYVNGITASLDSKVCNNDCIEINYAKDGLHGTSKVYEYLDNYDTINFYIDDILYTIEPRSYINGQHASLNSNINHGDDVKIIIQNTLGEFLQHNNLPSYGIGFYIDSKKINNEYVICNNDKITTSEQEIFEESTSPLPLDSSDIIIADEVMLSQENPNSNESSITFSDSSLDIIEGNEELLITVNGKTVTLRGKSEYIFIDIFDFIDFDRTTSKGTLVLSHNGKNASYYEPIKYGDSIDIYWN